MELKDTADLMLSDDFKDRVKAEYYQLENRAEGLRNMLNRYAEGTLDFTPNCSYDMLHTQLVFMDGYLEILRMRAEIEKIEL